MYKVGDRVIRLARTIGEADRHGIVVEVYNSKPNHLGNSLELYAVKWDGQDYTTRDYLEIGLRHEQS